MRRKPGLALLTRCSYDCPLMTSPTHLVLMPTYNSGPRLPEVVQEVLDLNWSILVVVDGSTDGSERLLPALAERDPRLSLLILPQNSGKGAAVLAGSRQALAQGFTHALVMDADGQHPAASIPEFMAESQRHPEALIVGRPQFPPNIPKARLYGRQLSIGLVWLELMGGGIDDPLFGFRVYPLQPLLDVLGTRRGGRRYDFETEAGVRLAWAGVPPRNVDAPVRYFSRDEGGISHFHYVRDNLTQIWLHARLLVELLWHWPAMLRNRRRWRATGRWNLTLALVAFAAGLFAWAPPLGAADPELPPPLGQRLTAGAADWQDLAQRFLEQPDVITRFTERRQFPFRKTPIELTGEVRASRTHGLSLHYLTPDERIVILDGEGLLMRGPEGQKAPPADPRAAGANAALRHILRLDFAALEKDFELYGERNGPLWRLTLLPLPPELKRSIGRMIVTGENADVRSIEIRRSANVSIEIRMDPPARTGPFDAAEIRRFFR